MKAIRQRFSSDTRRAAFTLIELGAVVMIVAIMAGIAVPRYARFLTRQRADAAAGRVMADLMLAQRQAKMTGTPQTVTFDISRDTYELLGMTDPDHPGRSYVVTLSGGGYDSALVTVDFGGDTEVIFDGFGVPDSGGTVSVGSPNYQVAVVLDGQTGKAARSVVPFGNLLPLPPKLPPA